MPAPTLIVIYAKEIAKVAAFYSGVLAEPVVDRDARFIIVGNAQRQLAVVQMADAIAQEIEIAMPPRLREDTPIKPSFLVDSLEAARAAAVATGGGTKPIDTAWRWRGELHLEAFDPEGNRVQLRTVVPGPDGVQSGAT